MLSDFHHDHFPDTWSEFYFDHFNYMFPLLSKDHFNKKDQEPLLKYATCALGALYASSDHHSLLFQRAQSILHDSATHCALSTVQALIIMCWYTHLTGDLQQCDLLRRQLAHMIEWLQFIQDDTPFTLESKRRAYWVAWVIDQWLTSCTLGERMLKEWQYPWPQLEDNQLNDPFLSSLSLSSTDNNHNTIQAFHQMIKLSIILKDIHQGNMSLQTLETNLTEWLLNLPSYLDYTKTSSAMAKLYRILYYTVQMALYQRHQHHLSHSVCITAANTILYITEQMMDTDQTVYTFNFFFLSLTFATSFIYLNSIISSSKHIHLLKQTNPTSLSAFELEQLVQHYLDPTPPIGFHVDQLLSFLDNESSTTITSTDSSYFSPTHSPSLKEEFIFDPLTVVTTSSTLFF
ncbi:hypothetical protein RMCBS344292_17448 [Rhizopus microsporus]|nr:hypothetical protein RMCBS344292_17448 [Rhizopus microsporus]